MLLLITKAKEHLIKTKANENGNNFKTLLSLESKQNTILLTFKSEQDFK